MHKRVVPHPEGHTAQVANTLTVVAELRFQAFIQVLAWSWLAPIFDGGVAEGVDHIGFGHRLLQIRRHLPFFAEVVVERAGAARVGTEAAGDCRGIDAAQLYVLKVAGVVVKPHSALQGIRQVADYVLSVDREAGVGDVAWPGEKNILHTEDVGADCGADYPVEIVVGDNTAETHCSREARAR